MTIFYNKSDSIFNKANPNFALSFYIAWSNGIVDSFESVKFRTGTNEIIENIEAGLNRVC